MALRDVSVKIGADTTGFSRGLKQVQGGLSSLAKTAAGLAGITFGLKTLTDFISTASRTETLNVAMKSVAKSSGYAISALHSQKNAVMALGIAEQESTQILTRFMQAQLDIADAAKIARVAQDAAVIAGMNSSQAAEQMTEAIAKQRPELLSAFGMTRNLNSIYSDYAKTVNKNVKQLTEFDRKQAMVNYILSEGERIAGTYEAAMGTVGKQIGSLPRLYATLKNAVAKPLALPAVSTVIDGITKGLQSSIAWAEANQTALNRWGQTAANVALFVINSFRWVTRTVAENWAAIKFVTTALVTYAVATRAIGKATAIWAAINLALKGQLISKIPILGTLSTAIGIYKVQVALAAKTSVLFTGALAKMKIALYAIHTALGPIGWALLALSLIVGVVMNLWSKYTQSLQKTPNTSNAAKDAIDKTTSALKDQAKAFFDTAKASKSLMGFDEINALQDNPSPPLDFSGLDSVLDWEEMLAGLEKAIAGAKPTFSGFMSWMWDGWSDWVNSWADWPWLNKVIDWGIVEWEKFWDRLQVVGELGKKLLAGDWKGLQEDAKTIISTIGEHMRQSLKSWDRPWLEKLFDWNLISMSRNWDYLQVVSELTKKALKGDWEGLREDAKTIFGAIGDQIGQSIRKGWSSAKDGFNSSKAGQWAAEVRSSIQKPFSNISNWFGETFTKAWRNVRNVFNPGGEIFSGIKEGISDAFKAVVNGLIRGINSVIRVPFQEINKTLNKIREVSILGLRPFQGLWSANPLPIPQFPMLAKGGDVLHPTMAMIGENSKREVVIPLERDSGWADILAEKLMEAGAGGSEKTPPVIHNHVYIGRKKVHEEMNAEGKRQNIKAGRNVVPVGG